MRVNLNKESVMSIKNYFVSLDTLDRKIITGIILTFAWFVLGVFLYVAFIHKPVEHKTSDKPNPVYTTEQVRKETLAAIRNSNFSSDYCLSPDSKSEYLCNLVVGASKITLTSKTKDMIFKECLIGHVSEYFGDCAVRAYSKR